jgi:hypothetical protein
MCDCNETHLTEDQARKIIEDTVQKSISQAERDAAPTHAGPHGSFPLGPGCKHVESAWNLAGHADNPGAIRSRVRAYASRHNCELPKTAMKAELDEKSVLAEMFHDSLHVNRVDHALVADCVLYDPALETSDAELPMVHKAYNPVSKSFTVEKAVQNEDGTATIEGWISTPHKDLEKDIAEPEAFAGDTFTSYFQRGAPVSSNHDTDSYPVGHLQKSVLVRDGVIIQTEVHPTDPREFLEGPGNGSGWYGIGVIDGKDASNAIKKGNIRSFSWIGNLAEYTPLTGGGRRYKRIDPLIETTVAAYPVNTKAVMRIAKSYGLDAPTEV